VSVQMLVMKCSTLHYEHISLTVYCPKGLITHVMYISHFPEYFKTTPVQTNILTKQCQVTILLKQYNNP